MWKSMCVHHWTLKIVEVEWTVLVSVRIFVDKINTYRLKDKTYGPPAELSIVSWILRVLNKKNQETGKEYSTIVQIIVKDDRGTPGKL